MSPILPAFSQLALSTMNSAALFLVVTGMVAVHVLSHIFEVRNAMIVLLTAEKRFE